MSHAQTNPIVELADVHLAYGPTEVLKGIDLSVARGQTVSIIGPSGSGKSTILRCINALVAPQKGLISVNGVRVDQMRSEAERIKLRQKIGIVFQQYNLFPHLSVLDNITLAPMRILRVNRTEAERHARDLLARVRLSEKAGMYPGQLSGGQQQRVAIARALAMRPDLVLFDEVTSALDPETVGEVLAVIRDLVKEGMTSILVTHEMRFAEEISDMVVFTENGQIVDQGPPGHIFQTSTNARIRRFVNGLAGARASVESGEGI